MTHLMQDILGNDWHRLPPALQAHYRPGPGGVATDEGGRHEHGAQDDRERGEQQAQLVAVARRGVAVHRGHAKRVRLCCHCARCFGEVKGFIGSTENWNAVALEFFGELECGLTTELHNNANWLFVLDDVVNMLPENRLKVEFIRRIKIRGNRFRVAVDHDRFVTTFFSS